jgi:hypothetical protein
VLSPTALSLNRTFPVTCLCHSVYLYVSNDIILINYCQLFFASAIISLAFRIEVSEMLSPEIMRAISLSFSISESRVTDVNVA